MSLKKKKSVTQMEKNNQSLIDELYFAERVKGRETGAPYN